ncbi:hypothetical protein J6590_073099 [Homalodisca vitripennis]|nr:hypothetical protein J6590_081710 [Homalodisca vitripennis]KAG8300580.1 hypothetical protein J6590_073099 [Homalodisca vitripennis]
MPVNVLQELNASLAEIVIRLEEQVAVLLANQSQPTTRSTRPPHCTGRTIIGEATCLDSSPTTSLCDGYLGSHTGRRTLLPHHPSDYTSQPPRSDKYKRILDRQSADRSVTYRVMRSSRLAGGAVSLVLAIEEYV